MGGLSKVFGNNENAVASPGEAAAKADMYICVNASTVELVDIEKYVAEYVGDKPIVLWNLELDTLRADLGNHVSSWLPRLSSRLDMCVCEGLTCSCYMEPLCILSCKGLCFPGPGGVVFAHHC